MTTTAMLKNFWLTDELSWLKALTSPRAGAVCLCVVLLLEYAILPFILSIYTHKVDSNAVTLIALTILSVVALAIGTTFSFVDPWFDGRRPRLVLSSRTFSVPLWSIFVLYVFVAWFTAPQIPLVAALTGADPATIAMLRELFLKAREGWQAAFVYVNAILTGALIPYSLALMFVRGTRGRWLAIGFFLVYSLSFVEKAFFLKAMLPLLVLVAQGTIKTRLKAPKLLLIIVGLLFFITAASGSGSYEDITGASFFSVNYVPQGVVQHIVWRLIAIPFLTAIDTIRVFHEHFDAQFFWGATSSFVSRIFSMERIELERLVFEAQWGQNITGTGSSNAVYIMEAFVNFGWFGVFIFSFTIGLLMRLFAVSRDEAFRAQWPLFALNLYSAGLIGLLLSNGFILLFSMALFMRLRSGSSGSRKALPTQYDSLPGS